MTYTSWSSDFMLHLEGNLMYDYHSLGLCDLYFIVLILTYISHYLMPKFHIYIIMMIQCDPNFDLKVNINQHDLYFMV